jgi:hypothetical protein
MMTKQRHWRDVPEIEREVILRQAKKLVGVVSWAEMGRRFHVRADSLARIVSPERVETEANLDMRTLLRMKMRLPADTRTITGRLFGDPLPGRSALESKRAMEAGR